MRATNGNIDLIKSTFADFERSKVRTFLTSLGIMIGVFSVVVLIALGVGLRNYIQNQFERMGVNLIIIMPGSMGSGDMGPAAGFGQMMIGGVSFDERDVQRLRTISEVDYVVPDFFKGLTAEYQEKSSMGYVMGTNEDIFPTLSWEILEGTFFNRSDVQRRSKIVVLGENIAERLFDNPGNAFGKSIRLANQRFKVVGVYKKTGDNEQDNGIVMPYTTTFGSINPDRTFWTIYLGVKSDKDVLIAKQKAEDELLKRYGKDEFSVLEQAELMSMIDEIFSIINTVLIAIGSISLIVGGIGIMNIMYATVTERTKEIGIRRAIGATEKDILAQFLAESVILSVLGGLVGLLMATVTVVLVKPFFPVAINLVAVVAAVTISSAIGIFFGVFPAKRAAKLTPLAAIQYQ